MVKIILKSINFNATPHYKVYNLKFYSFNSVSCIKLKMKPQNLFIMQETRVAVIVI